MDGIVSSETSEASLLWETLGMIGMAWGGGGREGVCVGGGGGGGGGRDGWSVSVCVPVCMCHV